MANAFELARGNYDVVFPGDNINDPNLLRGPVGLKRFMRSNRDSVKELPLNHFDLVYTAGLYDYVPTHPTDDTKGVVALTKNLFELVKPGGNLVIGNFSENNPDHLVFPMEFIYDWELIYRNEKEMLDFAKTIPKGQIADIEVLTEPLKINYFLKISKQ